MLLSADKYIKVLALLLGLSACFALNAQHAPVNAQYLTNALPLNPAFSGSREAMSVALTYRNQWSGIEGAPVTQTLAAHSPGKNRKLAYGLLVYRDAIGVSKRNAFMLNMAYRLKLGQGKLSFGLSGGMVMQSNEWSKITTTDEAEDLVFSGGDDRFSLPDFGAGLYYSNKKYFFSLSAPSMMQHQYAGGQSYTSNFVMDETTVFASAGARFALNPSLKIQPSFLMRSIMGDLQQVDLNLLLNYQDFIELGVSYRSSNAFLAMLRYHFNGQFALAYSSEMESGSHHRYLRMSHEMTLTYDFIFKTNTVSPKFF
jgi:type IX secretion system PorP/SprF family membrane protein